MDDEVKVSRSNQSVAGDGLPGNAAVTLSWMWGIVRNPPVEWESEFDGSIYTEQFTRRQRYQLLRPLWLRYLFTVRKPCGCRKRFGVRRVIICMEHSGFAKYMAQEDDT